MGGWDRELPPPRVQDPEETGQIPAQVLLVSGEGLDGVRGGGEERAIPGALMTPQERAQGLRHGESEEAVMPGQGLLEPRREPRLALGALALRAVAIPAGAERPVRVPARAARVADHPAGVGSAGHEGPERLTGPRRHSGTRGSEVLGAERPEALTERAQGPALPGRRR
jgi:hypothetical protein